MQSPNDLFFQMDELVPSLREVCIAPPLDPKQLLKVVIAIEDPGKAVPTVGDRRKIHLTQGEHDYAWEVESLRSLFRGNKQPPRLGDFPAAYDDSFMLLELHVLEISHCFGDRRDAEMLEIYSMLRRRPDGKSLGFVHDYMWQAAALVLGTRPLSQPEFEAIVSRLERSCRTFEQGATSRNYVSTLRMTLGQETDALPRYYP